MWIPVVHNRSDLKLFVKLDPPDEDGLCLAHLGVTQSRVMLGELHRWLQVNGHDDRWLHVQQLKRQLQVLEALRPGLRLDDRDGTAIRCAPRQDQIAREHGRDHVLEGVATTASHERRACLGHRRSVA